MEHNEKTQILKDVDAKVDDTRDKSTVSKEWSTFLEKYFNFRVKLWEAFLAA